MMKILFEKSTCLSSNLEYMEFISKTIIKYPLDKCERSFEEDEEISSISIYHPEYETNLKLELFDVVIKPDLSLNFLKILKLF